MPKATRKYTAAIETAHKAGLTQPGGWATNQEDVYQALNQAGYHWNSETNAWEQWTDEPADQPTEFVMVRVWAAAETVGDVTDDLVRAMRKAGARLMERSNPYPCRPPKQQEARVYLKFLPERKFHQGDDQ